MNHALAGCDSSALDDFKQCPESDWCAHGFACIDWVARAKTGEKANSEELKNFEQYIKRWKEMKKRMRKVKNQRKSPE